MPEELNDEIIQDAVESLRMFMGGGSVPEHLVDPVTGAPWNFHAALGLAREAALREQSHILISSNEAKRVFLTGEAYSILPKTPFD